MGQNKDLVLEPDSPNRTMICKQLKRNNGAAPEEEPWKASFGAPQDAGTEVRRDQVAAVNMVRPENRNILLVSDDEGQRSLLRAYLQHVGFKVFSCADLDSALRMVSGGRTVQLLLVDSHLLAAANQQSDESLASLCPNLLVFAISGKRTADGTLLEVKHRVCGKDSQSFQLPDLLGRIQALVDPAMSADVSIPEPAYAEKGKIIAFPESGLAKSKAANYGEKAFSGKEGRLGSKTREVHTFGHRERDPG